MLPVAAPGRVIHYPRVQGRRDDRQFEVAINQSGGVGDRNGGARECEGEQGISDFHITSECFLGLRLRLNLHDSMPAGFGQTKTPRVFMTLLIDYHF